VKSYEKELAVRRLILVICSLLCLSQIWQQPYQAGAAGAPAALTFSQLGGAIGSHQQAIGSGLPASTTVQLVWFRGAPHWQIADGDFNGIKIGATPMVIATGATDAQGKVTIPFTVPSDFGYIHMVSLEAGGKTLAQQGFTVIPTLAISPSSGPVGTPITVTFSGVGYRLYESVWHLVYDNANTGWLSAITTQGIAKVVIPATGAVGLHTIQALSGTHPVPYLNQQQAPIYQPLIPTVLGATFRVTAGSPVLPSAVAQQTLARAAGPTATSGSGPQVLLDHLSGTVGSPLTINGTGFAAGSSVQLSWSTVVGNRISGSGYASQDRPLAQVKADGSGAITYTLPTPDDLGGPHTITASGSGNATATAQYTITPNAFPISPQIAAPGQQVTVHLKGVGWTQTANIYTLVLDNNYIGYACGFNSQGDVTIHILAPGTPGIHYADLYPAIYQGNLFGSAAAQNALGGNVSYFQIPMLNVIDHPGEQLPAFHLTFQVQG
jgi:hypothetical protein